MVDRELINIGNISNEERAKIINYVMKRKGARAKDLGITINLISMIRSDKRRVTEDLLCRAKFLSTEEMAKLLGQIPELESATANDIVRVIARARAETLENCSVTWIGTSASTLGRWARGGLWTRTTLRSSSRLRD